MHTNVKEKRFVFEVELVGIGTTTEEAWENALEWFIQNKYVPSPSHVEDVE